MWECWYSGYLPTSTEDTYPVNWKKYWKLIRWYKFMFFQLLWWGSIAKLPLKPQSTMLLESNPTYVNPSTILNIVQRRNKVVLQNSSNLWPTMEWNWSEHRPLVASLFISCANRSMQWSFSRNPSTLESWREYWNRFSTASWRDPLFTWLLKLTWKKQYMNKVSMKLEKQVRARRYMCAHVCSFMSCKLIAAHFIVYSFIYSSFYFILFTVVQFHNLFFSCWGEYWIVSFRCFSVLQRHREKNSLSGYHGVCKIVQSNDDNMKLTMTMTDEARARMTMNMKRTWPQWEFRRLTATT